MRMLSATLNTAETSNALKTHYNAPNTSKKNSKAPYEQIETLWKHPQTMPLAHASRDG